MFKKSVIPLLVLWLFFPFISFAETVVLKSGQTIEGRIIERTDEYIKVDFQGITLTYFLNEISSIEGLKDSSKPKAISLSEESKIYKDKMDIFRDFRNSIIRIVVLGNDSEQKKFAGTGFVIDRSGIVVTNYHVVYNARAIEIVAPDEKSYPVEYIIAFSMEDDFCIFKAPCSFGQSFRLGDSSQINDGDRLFALGFTSLENAIATEGFFLRKGKVWDTETFYTSVASTFGCSGGPLINTHGEIVGIVQGVLTNLKKENISIPINKIKNKIGLNTRFSLNSLQKSSPFIKLSLAQINCYIKDSTKALFYLNELFDAGSVNDEVYYTRGIVYYELGKHEEALGDFNAAIKLNPFNGSAYCYRGLVHRENSNYDKSIADFNKAIEIDPNDDPAYCNRGVSYYKKANLDQAISDYSKAIEINPQSIEAYNNRGAAYDQKGNLDQAISDYSKAIEINPRFAEAYNGRAVIFFERRYFNEAWDDVHKAEALGLKVHPGFFEALKKASGREN